MATFDSALVNTVLANAAISKLSGRLAWLPAFCYDASSQALGINTRTINVPFASAYSAAVADPTDYEAGSDFIINRQVNLQHISKTASITQQDLESGRKLEWLATNTANAVANKIEQIAFAYLNPTNFPSVVNYAGLGNMSLSTIQSGWGLLPGNVKNAVLADSEYKNFLQANLFSFPITDSADRSAFGFDVFTNTNAGFASAGVGTGVRGLVCAPQALCMASYIPAMTPQVADLLDSTVVEVPELGLSFQSNLWGSSKTRQTFHSVDVLFGAAVGDNTAGVLLTAV